MGTYNGTDGEDRYQGTDYGDDVAYGNGGDDYLDGSGGSDTLVGGDGNDHLYGGHAEDYSNGYYDFLDGGAGNDSLSLTSSEGGTAYGGDGDDHITCSAPLYVDAGAGDDYVAIVNYVVGGLHGGAGTDVLMLSFETGFLSDVGTLMIDGFENLVDTFGDRVGRFVGSSQDDRLSLSGVSGLLAGNSFSIHARDGNDNIIGSYLNDAIYGDAGDDKLSGAAGDDTVDGGAGIDVASYADARSAVAVSLLVATPQNTIGAGIDRLVSIENLQGSAYGDTLTGSAETNFLTGDGGNDRLSGLAGDDTLSGGRGNDVLDGGIGNDTASYLDAAGAVVIRLATAAAQNTLGGGVDKLVGIENLLGSTFADNLLGDAGDNSIGGRAGEDTLRGGDGDDLLQGGTGGDILTGGLGADRFVYAAVGDSTVAHAGRDRIRDFSHAQGDRIDLSAIDAVRLVGSHAVLGNDAFTFVAGDGFGHRAGELIVTGSDGKWLVQGDVHGDGVADFAIEVASATALTAADFIL